MEAIGLREVGGVGVESNVMNSDECTKEFQRVFDSIDVAEFDPKDCCGNRDRRRSMSWTSLEVYRTRPRQWASSVPVIPTKWVDEGGAKQLEYCSRLGKEEPERQSSIVKCVDA